MTYVGPELPLVSGDVREWLAGLLPDEKFFPGPTLPKYPKRMVVVSPSQGGGLSMEFAFDRPSFQIHVVGPQTRLERVNEAAAQAEKLIFQVDRAILTAPFPLSISGHWVTHAQRFGAGPTPLPVDGAGRSHFTATYLMEAETGYAY